MSTLSTIILTCFILLLWNQMIDGLTCYTCTNCNDPFNSNSIPVINLTDSASYSCSKTSVGYVTARSIVSNCTSYGIVGNGQWCCQTNLCNGAENNILTESLSLNISILMFVIFFFSF